MFIAHLPRFHCPTSPSSPHPLLSTPNYSFSPNPNCLLLPLPSPHPKPTQSYFSSIPALLTVPSHTHPENPENLSPPEEARIEIPIGKLFVPPETNISPENTPLRTRILKGSNIVLSKYAIARDAQVVQAEFVKSSGRTEDCPSDGLPEFALVGRSNVGKSSLLNSLVRRKGLALTSKKPGKTMHQPLSDQR